MRYDVIMVGFRLNAAIKPAQALEMVLGLEASIAKELSKKFPVAVLSGVDRAHAERAADELTDAGAKVELRESSLGHAAQPTVAAHEALGSFSGPNSPAARPSIGNYELGEIFAPRSANDPIGPVANQLYTQAASAPAEVTETANEEMAAFIERTHTPAAEPPRGAPMASAADSLELDTDLPFSGMRNFDDVFASAQSPENDVAIDENALQAVRDRSPRTPSDLGHASLVSKLRGFFARLGKETLAWTLSLLATLAISVTTLCAIGYALDPDDIVAGLLRAFGR